MGLLDKYVAKMAAKAPDYGAILTEQLGPSDSFVAWGQLFPAAYERGGGGGSDLASKLLNKAVNSAASAVSAGRHIGGEPDSIGQSLPRDGDLTFAALSAKGVSLWDFGMMGTDIPPKLILRISGDHIASVVDTGKKAQGGAIVARFTFTDESFFDYRILPTTVEFLAGCIKRWPA